MPRSSSPHQRRKDTKFLMADASNLVPPALGDVGRAPVAHTATKIGEASPGTSMP